MAATQKVNVIVESIKNGDKAGWTNLNIRFDGEGKIYSYFRKCNRDENGNRFAILSGCRITFDENNQVLGVTREYDTKGVRRQSTKSLGKKEEEAEKTTSEKIKDEIEEKKIETPVIPEAPKGEIHHEQYETIKMCLEAKIPVYLAGPAGSGKNHTVEQIAKELGWNFYFSNSVQQEYKLTGFIDAGGKFHETEFYKACTDENDCVFFLDEMDASIPEVLVLLNAAIANGYFEFPTGRIDLKHVHFVAAGNTVGSGADEMYTGRMVLDQATLDRFAIIEFDYSINIEMSITKNNSELVQFIHNLRDVSKRNGIRATFSYRCMTMVTKLEKANMPADQIMKIAVVKGLDQDTINTLRVDGSDKYSKALKSLQTSRF